MNLVAEFISPQKVYTFSFLVGQIIPKVWSIIIHSATKRTGPIYNSALVVSLILASIGPLTKEPYSNCEQGPYIVQLILRIDGVHLERL